MQDSVGEGSTGQCKTVQDSARGARESRTVQGVLDSAGRKTGQYRTVQYKAGRCRIVQGVMSCTVHWTVQDSAGQSR